MKELLTANIDSLKHLAATLPPAEPVPEHTNKSKYQSNFDLESWLSKYNIEVQRKDNYEGGYRYILQNCPFNPIHNGTSAAVFQMADGSLGFKCQHNECSDRGWIDLRELKEPGYKNRGNGHSKQSINTTVDLHSFNRTDLGNAERLVHHFGANLLYNYDRKSWLVWRGTHWEWDFGGEIKRLAQKTVRKIYEEASGIDDEDERKKMADWAKNSESNQRVNGMIEQAMPMVKIPLSRLDSNHWLFNCQNGTIDLRTGVLREHRKDDFLTLLSPVEYDSNGKCDLWLTFLNRVCQDKQPLIDYLQRCIGYSLSGDTSEQVLFFAHGTGMNGKSSFLNVFGEIMAQYATQANVEMFLTNKPGNTGHTEDIANLAGKRMVVASEIEDNRRMSVSKIKQMTGGEKVRASHKYEREFEYEVTYKIWLNANHKPEITDTTYSIWRRVKRIPFDVTIPKSEQDKRLKDKFRKEYPGILAWAVRGCVKWLQTGLTEPLEVSQATDTYRVEQDILAEFFKNCCHLEPDNAECTITHKDLFDGYQKWCATNSIEPVSSRTFAKRLKEKNTILKFTSSGQIKWRYIRLLKENEPVDEVDNSDEFPKTLFCEGDIGKKVRNSSTTPTSSTDTQGLLSTSSTDNDEVPDLPEEVCPKCGKSEWVINEAFDGYFCGHCQPY